MLLGLDIMNGQIQCLLLGSYIDTIVWSVVVDAVTDILDGRYKTYWRARVVLYKFAWGKGSVRRPKALFLSYCTKTPLIQNWKVSQG